MRWTKIPGFSDYSISDLGQIKGPRSGAMRFQITWNKYLRVGLYKNRRSHNKFVHVLVLESFVGPRPKNYECGHLDGDPQNNKLTNLRWVSRKENQFHRKLHGTHDMGEKSSQAKLTEKQVKYIRKVFCRGQGPILAKKFGVTSSAIYAVINRESWAHI